MSVQAKQGMAGMLRYDRVPFGIKIVIILINKDKSGCGPCAHAACINATLLPHPNNMHE
jgi:hypothetical protein